MRLDWFSFLIGILTLPGLGALAVVLFCGWVIFSPPLFPDQYSRSIEDDDGQ